MTPNQRANTGRKGGRLGPGLIFAPVARIALGLTESRLGMITRTRLFDVIWLTSLICAVPVCAAGIPAEEEAIRLLIEQRRIAWNAEDVDAYARLLAEDVDILSSTGRSASGREEVIRLYVEQRSGAYQGATIASTVVTRIKFVRPDVAVADADAELAGLRGREGNTLGPIKGQVVFVVVKEAGTWLISSIRGVTRIPVQSARQETLDSRSRRKCCCAQTR
jgi:uncharacterized protein (TIGR02246 family)